MAVREYKFYSIRKDGHINGPPKNLVANDDANAIQEAKQLIDGHDIEIWQGPRLVAYIVPEKDKTDDGMDTR